MRTRSKKTYIQQYFKEKISWKQRASRIWKALSTKDGGADDDIKSRINKARHAFNSLLPILNSRALSFHSKTRIFSTNVKAVLLYGSGTWRESGGLMRRAFHYIIQMVAAESRKSFMSTRHGYPARKACNLTSGDVDRAGCSEELGAKISFTLGSNRGGPLAQSIFRRHKSLLMHRRLCSGMGAANDIYVDTIDSVNEATMVNPVEYSE
ncbi:hypothetical protein C0Q70_05899 [Pomacea canaliculata]|uniref:DUF6451 domain-containing protein n=1 Tax=Pomacea canaliculata TaxID=400727 RepID=A0A2T7PMH8_POMCA|nr:hypothetical protein C0Q70_05899 [Pomacea canaliculata]